jgi:hypothetical protein
MRNCESCGFCNVNDLSGIFCHLYLGLKVFIFLKELDEGGERLRWAVFGGRGGQPTQSKDYIDLLKSPDTAFVNHGIALCSKCIGSNNFFASVAKSCGHMQKRYDFAKGFSGASF